MIQFNCTDCGKTYKVKDEYQGKRMRCKPCGTINQVPITGDGSIASDDSVTVLNKLLGELSDYEKTAPELDFDDQN